MNPVAATTIRRLMRQYKVSAAQIAAHFNISRERIAFVRKHGGPWDWPLMIQTVAAR